LTLSELTKKLNISKSTIFRILLNLEDEGFVSRKQHTNKYYIGKKIFELSQNITQESDIRKIALPFMRELSYLVDESVSLHVIYDEYSACIEKIESTQRVTYKIELGRPIPLFAGAAGKAILAFLSKEKIKYIINHTNFTKFAKNTISNPAKLLKELEKIRKEGYATSFEELVCDGASVATAIFDKNKKVIASLNIATIVSRLKEKEKITFHASLLKEFSKKISSRLG